MAAHRYWRINVSANNGSSNVAIGEMQMMAVYGGGDQCEGGTPAASSTLGGYSVTNVFLNNGGAGFWVAGTNSGWVSYTWTQPVDIVQYSITTRSDGFTVDAPKDWTFEFSDDGVAWTVKHTMGSETAWIAGQTRYYSMPISAPGGLASGGIEEILGEYKIHTFLYSGVLEVQYGGNAEILLVGGGGGGGDRSGGGRGAGGGAGGLIHINSYPLIPGNYVVSRGGGGAHSTSGENTVVSGNGRVLTALGGGHGGFNDNTNNAEAGGSGGGQWYPGYTGAVALQNTSTSDGAEVFHNSGFGNSGGTSGGSEPYASGGGGAGGRGGHYNEPGGPVGGPGLGFDITGSMKYYAGGGGGCGWNNSNRFAGGIGGGGRGWNAGTDVDQSGDDNTGGGGGSGGSGGSGIVVIKYKYSVAKCFLVDRYPRLNMGSVSKQNMLNR